jgi:hypothetical protein
VIQAACPSPKGRGWWILPLLLLGLGGFVVPARTAAQVTSLQQRQADYETAKAALVAHSSAWSSQELAWQSTLDSLSAAVRSGDRNRREAADFRSQAAAFELQRIQILVDNARRDLESKRRALEEAIEQEIAVATTRARTFPAERATLTTRINSLDTQLEQLQAEAVSTRSSALTYLPGLNPDPRMGPIRVNALVLAMEDRMRETQAEIQRVDQELSSALQRQARLRNAGDRTNNLRRFGADQPVGAAQPTNVAGTEATGTGPSLEDRIQQLKAQRAVLLDMMQQLNVRVSTIRRTLGGVA